MKSMLKFITCGSVDDGKSTLIGHMLYDAKLLFTDHLQSLELDSRVGSRDGEIDYSLLLDGLMAEREQGITIDVAYRYFTTNNRSFIVADCPGHEQYTRNMAVGASFADLAVILVDVANGVSIQTKRHLRICALMGIRHVVLAVNKMDLTHYDMRRFQDTQMDFMRYAAEFKLDSLQVIPLSAVAGDNVVKPSEHMPWYDGPVLLEYLENIDVSPHEREDIFVLPVQRTSRPNHTFRGFQGQVEAGRVIPGAEIISLPSGEKAHVKDILVSGVPAQEAVTGQAVTLTLDREMDVSRGCVLTTGKGLQISDMFTCSLLWMDEKPLVAGRNYLLKCGTRMLPATVLTIKHKVEIDTGKQLSARELYKNEIAVCDISLSERVVLDTFESNRALGSFILIDRVSNMTSACGVIAHTLRRSTNVVWQDLDITRQARAEMLGQSPRTIWFTGLSGSGKSVLANALEKRLCAMGRHTMLLDGDNIRHGLNRDLGFTERDRVENIRRIAEVARLMNEAGLIVLTAFISPYAQDRQRAREIIGADNFVEVYVSTPLSICEQRDVKGLYKKARNREIPEFTGITSPYEAPENPSVVIDTSNCSVEEALEKLLDF